MTTADLTLEALKVAYSSGTKTPTQVCHDCMLKVVASHAVFVSKPKMQDVLERCT